MTEVRRMGNALIIPLDRIEPHPANVREQLGDLTDLAESIRRKGLLQAVVVRPLPSGRFQLITGHRRCAAARMVGREVVPAIVREEATDADVVEDMLMENLHRRRLNPIEEANAFQALTTMRDWTQAQVAAAVGVSVNTVNARIALLELSEAEQRAIANKAMSLGEGWQLVHERRWDRGERRGQGHHGGKEARPRWVPHFNTDHPLADEARSRCRSTHTAPRSTKLADVACGPCWEAVLRADALRGGGVPVGQLTQSPDGAVMKLTDAALGDTHLVPDLGEVEPVESAGHDVAIVVR